MEADYTDTLNKITVTDIKELFTVFSPRGRKEKIANRRSYGLSFCSEGIITYELNGEYTISDKSHAVILPKGQSYSLYGNKSGVFPVINFDCKNFLCDKIVSIPLQNVNPYIHEYEKMKSLSLFSKNRTEIMSIFYGMLYRLSTENSVESIILPAVTYIENNYRRPEISNSELAKKCNISEVYLRKKFAEIYNTTPKQFIIDIRINRAKQLLSEGILKVGSISEECGFSNQFHFCRLFKEKTGLTPTEYMKQNRIHKI